MSPSGPTAAACSCGCTRIQDVAAHAIVAALAQDDLDRAIALGLLDDAIACASCSESCRARLGEARSERQRALAARERHRARNERLQRRQRERDAQRSAARPAQPAAPAGETAAAPSALPSAAAQALARARAKAAERRKP